MDSVNIRRCNGNREAWFAEISKGCFALCFTDLSLDSMIQRLEREGYRQATIKLTQTDGTSGQDRESYSDTQDRKSYSVED